MNVMCGWVWCEDVVSYHERGRLRPEGVGVIAHVHYACESYPGRHHYKLHVTVIIKRGGRNLTPITHGLVVITRLVG